MVRYRVLFSVINIKENIIYRAIGKSYMGGRYYTITQIVSSLYGLIKGYLLFRVIA